MSSSQENDIELIFLNKCHMRIKFTMLILTKLMSYTFDSNIYPIVLKYNITIYFN